MPKVVVVLAPAESTIEDLPLPDAMVTAGLAAITDSLLENGRFNSLVLIDGDGADAVLNRLRALSVLVSGPVREGIPVSVIERGAAQGLTVVTKVGGFRRPASVLEIVTKLLGPRIPEAFP